MSVSLYPDVFLLDENFFQYEHGSSQEERSLEENDCQPSSGLSVPPTQQTRIQRIVERQNLEQQVKTLEGRVIELVEIYAKEITKEIIEVEEEEEGERTEGNEDGSQKLKSLDAAICSLKKANKIVKNNENFSCFERRLKITYALAILYFERASCEEFSRSEEIEVRASIQESYEEAGKHFKETAQLLERKDLRNEMAAQAYVFAGTSFEKASRIRVSMSGSTDVFCEALSYKMAALLYQRLNKFEQALEFFKKSFILFVKDADVKANLFENIRPTSERLLSAKRARSSFNWFLKSSRDLDRLLDPEVIEYARDLGFFYCKAFINNKQKSLFNQAVEFLKIGGVIEESVFERLRNLIGEEIFSSGERELFLANVSYKLRNAQEEMNQTLSLILEVKQHMEREVVIQEENPQNIESFQNERNFLESIVDQCFLRKTINDIDKEEIKLIFDGLKKIYGDLNNVYARVSQEGPGDEFTNILWNALVSLEKMLGILILLERDLETSFLSPGASTEQSTEEEPSSSRSPTGFPFSSSQESSRDPFQERASLVEEIEEAAFSTPPNPTSRSFGSRSQRKPIPSRRSSIPGSQNLHRHEIKGSYNFFRDTWLGRYLFFGWLFFGCSSG